MHPFPYGTTLTMIRRVLSGTDDYGNDAYSDVSVSVGDCVINPVSSNETTNFTDQVNTTITVFVPFGTDVSFLEAFVINGEKYEVQGDPETFVSPFSGHVSPIQIRAIKTTGASA